MKFLFGAAIAFVVVQGIAFAFLFHGCSNAFYGLGYYMAYCDGNFSYYEHGGLYYGIEREAIKNLVSAEILFLGDSRSQVAFSTRPVAEFFHDRGDRYYLLGFSYGETDRFPEAIISKYKLRPKMLVINASPFFVNSASAVAVEILGGNRRDEYLYKRAFQWIHAASCRLAIFERVGICGSRMTVFRSPRHGEWAIANWLPANIPIRAPIAVELGPIDAYVDRARTLLDQTGLTTACVVLTVVPANHASPDLGRQIARQLGSPFILPETSGLLTVDGNHLTQESAERWSGDFVAQLAPLLHRCGL